MYPWKNIPKRFFSKIYFCKKNNNHVFWIKNLVFRALCSQSTFSKTQRKKFPKVK